MDIGIAKGLEAIEAEEELLSELIADSVGQSGVSVAGDDLEKFVQVGDPHGVHVHKQRRGHLGHLPASRGDPLLGQLLHHHLEHPQRPLLHQDGPVLDMLDQCREKLGPIAHWFSGRARGREGFDHVPLVGHVMARNLGDEHGLLHSHLVGRFVVTDKVPAPDKLLLLLCQCAVVECWLLLSAEKEGGETYWNELLRQYLSIPFLTVTVAIHLTSSAMPLSVAMPCFIGCGGVSHQSRSVWGARVLSWSSSSPASSRVPAAAPLRP